MSKKYAFLLILLALLSVLFFSSLGPITAILLAVSLVGMPFVLVMMAAPILLPMAIIAWGTQRYLASIRKARPRHGLDWLLGWAAGVVITAICLVLVPIAPNQIIESRIAALTDGDIEGPVHLDPHATLAVAGRNGEACDQICQRLLLNGQIDAYIAIAATDDGGAVSTDAPATRYWRADGQDCPPLPVDAGTFTQMLPGETNNGDLASLGDLLLLDAANGICLLSAPANTGEADAVITYGTIAKGQTAFDAGLDLNADTVHAGQLSYALRENGKFALKYRKTGILAEKLFPVLLFVFEGGYGLELAPAFLRRPEFRNTGDRSGVTPDIHGFLQDGLGLDLIRHRTIAPDAVHNLIVTLLSDTVPVSQLQLTLVSRYLADINSGLRLRDKTIPDDSAQLVLALMKDERIPVLRDVVYLIPKLIEIDPSIADDYAKTLFARLKKTAPENEYVLDKGPVPEMYVLAQAIDALPDHVLLSYLHELDAFIHREGVLRLSAGLLRRFENFGSEAVPTLVYLVDALKRQDQGLNDRFSSGAYADAWRSLCTIGEDARSAVPALYAHLETYNYEPTSTTVVKTLLALGESPDVIWQQVQRGPIAHGRETFDHAITRARAKPDCR